MLETLVALGLTVTLVALFLPVALLYLLTRQIAPYHPLRTLLVVLTATLLGGPFGLAAGLAWAAWVQTKAAKAARRAARPATYGIGRTWSTLAHDATVAGQRYHAAIAPAAAGPLRDTLAGAAVEVDEAVAEAQRLALQGDRTERAHRDILRALDAQRGRSRSSGGASDHALQAATRAQHASAERLAATARDIRSRLEVTVARLHELTGHALELTAIGSPQPADLEVADRLAALRAATAELDALAVR